MNTIPINERNDNLAIVSKLLKSVAVKYDCNVTYNPEAGTVAFSGDEDCKSHIVEETAAMFQAGY